VPSYQTEIEIPFDRYVCLQLPNHLPEGRALVTVRFLEASEPGLVEPHDDRDESLDREDIEWWEEFDESPEPLE
jgi:hypothetical protein